MRISSLIIIALCLLLLSSCSDNLYNVQDGPVVSITTNPQPAHDYANYSFSLLEPSRVTLTLENLTGVVLNTLIDNNYLNSGRYELNVDLKPYGSGYYIMRIKSSKYIYETILVVKKEN